MHDQTKPDSRTPVLIVGAGPTGLLLAIELARRDVAFRLVDKRAEPAPWSAAIFIKARSLEILRAVGVLDAFLARGQKVDRIDVHIREKRVGSYRLDDLDTPDPYILSIPEQETVALLTERLEALSGRVERGVEFTGLEEKDGVLSALLTSETGTERLRTDWIVGTDGYHSAVRDAVADPFEGNDYPEIWCVLDTRMENWRHPRNVACAQLAPPNVIPFPMGRDLWRIYCRPEQPDDETAFQTVEEGIDLVSPGARLLHPGKPQFFKSHSRLARHYRVGHVFLAGDAAHGSNPMEGHGMNTGLQDAFNLGWKLAFLAKGKGGDALIDSYEAERRPVGEAIIESGDATYKLAGPEGAEDRQNVVEFLSTADGRHTAALSESELGYAYPEGGLIEEVSNFFTESELHTPIGTRVGNAENLVVGDESRSLFDLIHRAGPNVFLLLPGEPEAALIAEGRRNLNRVTKTGASEPVGAYLVLAGRPASTQQADDLIFDAGGKLMERLCGAGETLCLVRPDGHLGFRSCPASFEALRFYLQRMFAAD